MTPFDLGAYLDRVGRSRPTSPDLGALRDLHAAHLAAIPFENLDVRLGRPIALGLDRLQEKMVQRRRGGYCFEQNTIFAAALRALGFRVDTLEARVRPPGATAILPRTHMVLRAEADGESLLVDVGFGGDGPLFPVPLRGGPSSEPLGTFQVADEGGGVHVLRTRADEGWRDLYAFTLIPALPVDFAVASHYTSTHPHSPFVNTLTVQRSTATARIALRGRTLTRRNGDGLAVRQLSAAEVVDLVLDELGLEVAEEEVLLALGPEP